MKHIIFVFLFVGFALSTPLIASDNPSTSSTSFSAIPPPNYKVDTLTFRDTLQINKSQLAVVKRVVLLETIRAGRRVMVDDKLSFKIMTSKEYSVLSDQTTIIDAKPYQGTTFEQAAPKIPLHKKTQQSVANAKANKTKKNKVINTRFFKKSKEPAIAAPPLKKHPITSSKDTTGPSLPVSNSTLNKVLNSADNKPIIKKEKNNSAKQPAENVRKFIPAHLAKKQVKRTHAVVEKLPSISPFEYRMKLDK